jgi:hypothetical protein
MSVEDGIPEEGQATPDSTPHDWEKDYKALQAEYTRSQQALKEWEDEETALRRFAEKFPHRMADEDEEETEDDEDFVEDPTVAELAALKRELAETRAWRQDVENERGERRFNTDLANELGDRQVNDRVKTWIKDRTFALGNNPDALKKAVQEWSDLERELKGEHIEQVTKSKKTQHVPAGGQAGTKVPDLDNQQERHAWLKQRVRELESQQ